MLEKDLGLAPFVGFVDHVGEEEIFDKTWRRQEDTLDNVKLDVFKNVADDLVEEFVQGFVMLRNSAFVLPAFLERDHSGRYLLTRLHKLIDRLKSLIKYTLEC